MLGITLLLSTLVWYNRINCKPLIIRQGCDMSQLEMLKSEIEELTKERNEMDVSLQNASSTPEYNAIQQNIDALNKRIADKQAQLAEQEKIEEKVNVDVPFAVLGVDLSIVPPDFVALISDIVKADRRRQLAEYAIELEQLENEKDEAILLIEAEVDELRKAKESLDEVVRRGQEVSTELHRENGQLNARLDELKLQNEDLSSKLRNAAVQLEEKDREIARLNSEIDDYQKAKVFGERQAQSIIEVTNDEAEEINDKIKKLFTNVEDWGSILKVSKPDGNFELVKRDEFQDNWAPEVPAYQGGSESNESFRDEDTQGNVADGGIPYPQAPSIDFRTEEHGLAEGNTGLEVAGEVVTREEFEAVKARIARIEERFATKADSAA